MLPLVRPVKTSVVDHINVHSRISSIQHMRATEVYHSISSVQPFLKSTGQRELDPH